MLLDPNGESSRTGPSVDSEVERVLKGRTLRRSEQLRRLLVYLAQAVKDPDPRLLSELEIGIRAFGRKDFNPKLDTIVRSEMLRLRRKLEEYYADEDPNAAFRLTLEKNSYRLAIVAHDPAETVASTVAPPPDQRRALRRTFWAGMASGLLVALVLAAIGFTYQWRQSRNSTASFVANHPIWRGFSSSQVEILVGTPLFFRTATGFERSFSVNTPLDLPEAQRLLKSWPAHPYWDLWMPYHSLPAVLQAKHALEDFGSTVALAPARDRSLSTLSTRRTIILGPPRFAPVIEDLIAHENFYEKPRGPGEPSRGIQNANPRPGEPISFGDGRTTLAQNSDESLPDNGLITSQVLPGGGVALSMFGGRAQSAGFLLQALLDRPLLDQLNATVFASPPSPGAIHKSAQIVVRIDYNHGRPIGVGIITHRVRY